LIEIYSRLEQSWLPELPGKHELAARGYFDANDVAVQRVSLSVEARQQLKIGFNI